MLSITESEMVQSKEYINQTHGTSSLELTVCGCLGAVCSALTYVLKVKGA